MKVKMLTKSAGPEGIFPAGSVRTVSVEEGEMLINAGFAQLVTEPEESSDKAESQKTEETKVDTETASLENAPETTEKTPEGKGKPRGRGTSGRKSK